MAHLLTDDNQPLRRRRTPGLVLAQVEIHPLDELVKDKPGDASKKKTLFTYLTKIARLGGYLARAHDAPPGNQVIWKGMSRLTDMELRFMVGVKTRR